MSHFGNLKQDIICTGKAETTEFVNVGLPPLVVPCMIVSILESMTSRILDWIEGWNNQIEVNPNKFGGRRILDN